MDRLRRRTRPAPPVAFDGWPSGLASPVDDLSDEDLRALNALLPWQCFTVDARGRRFGDRAWTGKRDTPQAIPDPRIGLMDDRFSLKGKRVLELGCFEGVHTIGLCLAGADVTAVDARSENVAKTAVRASLYGCNPQLLVRDLEGRDALSGLDADLAHHVGVLYHLEDPVRHLVDLGRAVDGLMLDTHVATEPEDAYEVAGRSFSFSVYTEGGRADVFSGIREAARWLTLDALVVALEMAGLGRVEVVEEREERNGPRVLVFAARPDEERSLGTELPLR